VELFRTILMVTKALASYTYKGREMVAKQEAQELLKHRSALAGEYFALADGRVSEEAQEFLALQTKILLQVVPDYKSNHRLSVCAFAGFTLEKEPLQDVILPSFPGPEPYGGEMGVTEWVQDDDPIDAICRFVSMVYLGVTPTPDILVAIAERMKRYLDGNGALSLDEAFGLKRKQRVGHPLKQRSQDERRGRIIYLMWCLRYKAKSEGKPGVSKSWGRGLRSMTRGDILLGD
jgi:hypothetical protein